MLSADALNKREGIIKENIARERERGKHEAAKRATTNGLRLNSLM